MSDLTRFISPLLAAAAELPAGRHLVAVAGPPASGKSTLADALVDELQRSGRDAALVPMDGFHLDNGLLEAHGLLDRKGAPNTFDLGGFSRLVAALGAPQEVIYPVFDRDRDIAIAGAGRVAPECEIVVIEGNYLLFDAAGWRDLARFWDVSAFLAVPESVLYDRLLARWVAAGLNQDAARARAESNDLPNAQTIMRQRLRADIELE
ncbi:MAG: nucleoside/nucleotide kinase family protein [Pseudomonadota bacterium]